MSKLKQSHPIRVRGLKFVFWETHALAKLVAPHTGAWIEMQIMATSESRKSSRTPYGCVDWNLRYLKVLYFHHRRTPYGCVDWNITKRQRCRLKPVAPHTGAWIEIKWATQNQETFARRTPYGCVDWNFMFVLHCVTKNSRTPYGCVDWNTQTNEFRVVYAKSHPIRVRGLK